MLDRRLDQQFAGARDSMPGFTSVLSKFIRCSILRAEGDNLVGGCNDIKWRLRRPGMSPSDLSNFQILERLPHTLSDLRNLGGTRLSSGLFGISIADSFAAEVF